MCNLCIASISSGDVKGFSYVYKLYDLELRLCFSVLCLKVRNCRLAFLSQEFAEISASESATSFLFFGSVLLFFCAIFEISWLGFR